jgi:autotransporter-associated beta strand protein
MNYSRVAVTLGILGVFVMSPPRSSAQTFTWVPTAGGSYNWYSSNPWNTNPFVGGTGVTAAMTANLAGAATVTLDNATTLNALNIGSGSSTFGYTVSGANLLTFDGTNPALTMTAGAANQAVNVPLAVNAALTVTNNSATGTLTLGGTIANGTNGVTFAGAGNITVGGTFLGTAGTITKNGAGTLTFSDPNAFGVLTTHSAYGTITTGDITVNGGTVVVQSINLRSSGTNANRGTGARGINLASGAVLRVNGTLNIEPDDSVYVTQITGPGTIQLRNGTSTMANPSFENDIGPSGGDANPWGTVITATVDVGAGTHWFLGTTNRNDVSRYAGDTRFDGSLTGSGNIQLRGTNVNSSRDWHVVFNASNAGYTGAVSIANADLNLTNNAALSAANAVTFNSVVDAATQNQAILFLWGHNVTIGSLNDTSAAGTANFIRNGSISGQANGGTNSNLNGATNGVALGLDADSTLTITQTSAGTFNGIIADGPNDNGSGATGVTYRVLNIIKAGTAALTLTGNNTYSGTTVVNAGTLLVNGQTGTNSGTGTGAVTVNTGGTLGGTGQVAGAVTVNGGGLIRGGSSRTVGTLTLLGNLTLVAGVGSAETTRTTVNSTTASLIQVNGQVNFSTTGATVAPTIDIENATVNPITPNTSYTRTIMTATGGFLNNGTAIAAGTIPAGTYALTSSDFASFTGVSLQITASNNLVLTFTPVPEPKLVLGLSLFGLAMIRPVRRLMSRHPSVVNSCAAA